MIEQIRVFVRCGIAIFSGVLILQHLFPTGHGAEPAFLEGERKALHAAQPSRIAGPVA